MDKEALDRSIARRLLRHIADGTTDMADEVMEMPVDVYTSDEYYEREMEQLFLDRPIVLTLSGSLPGPNTYLTVDVAGVPVLLTRAPDGKVRSFANMCRHRGVRVVDGHGKIRRLMCPFHAWVYDLQGSLVGVPVAEGFEGLCQEEKGLIELPVAEGYGLVVGRLRPGPAVDVEEYLGPDLAGELALLDFGDYPLLGEPHKHEVNANWKVTLDTYRENYHFDFLHRDTLAEYAYGGVLTFDAFGDHVRNASAVRTIDALVDRPEEEWGDVSKHFSYQYALFPNLCLTLDFRHVEFWQILPLGPHRSEVTHMIYQRPDLPEEESAKLVEMAPWICEKVVDGEDFWVAGRTEPGIRTGYIGTVIFGRNEPAPQHMHRSFMAALGESRP